MPTKAPRAKLVEFLRSAFTSAELSAFTGTYLSVDLRHELPTGVSLAETCEALVDAIERHGMIDAGFFEALTESRKLRETEVVELRNLFGYATSNRKTEKGAAVKAVSPETTQLDPSEIIVKKLGSCRRSLDRAVKKIRLLRQICGSDSCLLDQILGQRREGFAFAA